MRQVFFAKRCIICETNFVPRNSRQLCCSAACSSTREKQVEAARHHLLKDTYAKQLAKFKARAIACAQCSKAFLRSNQYQTQCRDCLKTQTKATKPLPACPVCGNGFKRNHVHQIRCAACTRAAIYADRERAAEIRKANEEDAATHSQQMKTRICKVCESEYVTDHYQVTCSAECAKMHTYRLKKQSYEKLRLSKFVAFVTHCSECQKEFKKRHPLTMTCSAQCSDARNLRLKRQKKNMVDRECTVCQNKFLASEKSNISVCSRECYRKREVNRVRLMRADQRKLIVVSSLAPVPPPQPAIKISKTIKCKACRIEIERTAAISDCCSEECRDYILHRLRVKTITELCDVGARVIVMSARYMVIDGNERLIETSDAGCITQISNGIATIEIEKQKIKIPVSKIIRTENIIKEISKRMGIGYYERGLAETRERAANHLRAKRQAAKDEKKLQGEYGLV